MFSRLAVPVLLVGAALATPLEDATGLFQRGATQMTEADVPTEITIDLNHPMKTMVDAINIAIAQTKEKMETSTREVIHRTSKDLTTLGQQLDDNLKKTVHEVIVSEVAKYRANHSAPANGSSLLEISEGSLPFGGKKEHKGRAINPFDIKGLVAAIDEAIPKISDNLEMGTRVLIHDTQEELKRVHDKLSQNLEQTMHNIIEETIKANVHNATMEMKAQMAEVQEHK